MAEPCWEARLLMAAWSDIDRALADVSEPDALHRIDGGSCFAWTLAHITNGIDSWINHRFLGLERNPLISDPRFAMGGDGSADSFKAIRSAVDTVRVPAREFLLECDARDLDRTVPYNGSFRPFREHGLNLRLAILQNAAHHTFHLGEIAAKRELMGYAAGNFPSSLVEPS